MATSICIKLYGGYETKHGCTKTWQIAFTLNYIEGMKQNTARWRYGLGKWYSYFAKSFKLVGLWSN